MRTSRVVAAVAASAVLATFVVTLLVLNLSLGNKVVDRPPARLYDVGSAEFERVMGAVLRPPLTAGNRARALVNGTEIFPAMLEAIRAARQTITLETYIYWSGTVGQEFTQALAEKSRRGVKVKVLLDWFGSDLDEALLEEMRASGVEISRYNPPRWYSLQSMNHRTHRRLMVVDGRIGFIGGAGLGDKWRGDAQDPQHWRDTHFRVEGPVVTQMQSAFIDNWLRATGEVLNRIEYFPEPADQGSLQAHIFTSGPWGGSKSMQVMYLLSITSAARSIDLSAAYFIPDEVALDSLVAALRRGVRVRIIMPGPHMDESLVLHASRAKWGLLLAQGAEIYQYQPTMFHCKVMVVDGLWTSVGSTNFDARSFSINDEANMNVYDSAFAEAQIAIFEADLKLSKRVTLEEWQGRSWWQRTLDVAASALDSQL